MTSTTSTFSLKTKSIFLTYPQCPEEKEGLLDYLLSKGAAKAVVAQEKHEDGNFHLHAYAAFEKSKMFRERSLDYKGYHPNMQSCRNIHAVLNYIKKDQNYTEFNMNVKAIENGKKNHKAVIAEELMLGKKTLREATDEHPELLFNYGTLRKNLELYRTDKAAEEKMVEEKDYPKEKKRHIWIYGQSDSGKSTKLKTILTEYEGNHFQIPYNNDWNGYRGERILWADEYKGQLTIQDLNRACDGNAKMNTKGGTVTLHPYPQIIICSNYTPDGCYCKADREIIKTIENRFTISAYHWKDDPANQTEPYTNTI